MPRFFVRQSGNRIELHGGREVVWYEVAGLSMPELTDHSFAIWHLLPTAIREGFDIAIDGPACDVVTENARNMAFAWELWQPALFRNVHITHSLGVGAITEMRHNTVTLFSGGVDSTHLLMQRGTQDRDATALTVHGMDYDSADERGFSALLRKTAPFLESLGYRRVVIRSNAEILTRGFHAHGMALAGYAFLMTELFDSAHLAADNNWEIDMLQFPWGLNHVTNRLFCGRRFKLITDEEHLSRSQKIATLADSPIALAAMTFCKRRDIRPGNCGRCRKCVRTKAMFLGMAGRIPPIFDSMDLPAELVTDAYRSSEVEAANLYDLYLRSRNRGKSHAVPGLEELVQNHQRESRLAAHTGSSIRRSPSAWSKTFVTKTSIESEDIGPQSSRQ